MSSPNLLMLGENLRAASARIGSCLDRLRLDAESSSEEFTAVTPQLIDGLLSELMRVGAWLRDLPSRRDDGLEQELGEYRHQVERLRDLLPSIHRALLEERARLEQERVRVNSAVQWARRSRQTF